jgi:glycerol-1-phosphate dehydrogenase [NAD(P)+]
MTYLHGGNWKHIRDALKKLGAPTNARELRVEKEDVLKALKIASSMRPERYTILDKLSLRRESYVHLAKVTEVI